MGDIAIIDYGMGNLYSVTQALHYLGENPVVCSHPEQLASADRVILPGVGAYSHCVEKLQSQGYWQALDEVVFRGGKPFLGICLGMQCLAKTGEEGGPQVGLGWFDAAVKQLEPSDAQLRIPHIGWNNISAAPNCPLFQGLPAQPDFYFVHSFAMVCNQSADIAATCDYGGPFVASVLRDNIFATQFHPEKSQENGLKLLENFISWTP